MLVWGSVGFRVQSTILLITGTNVACVQKLQDIILEPDNPVTPSTADPNKLQDPNQKGLGFWGLGV